MVADELRRQADTFLELQDLAPSIQRPAQWREQREPREPRDTQYAGAEGNGGETIVSDPGRRRPPGM